MNIIVVHGEDTAKSYERLKKFIATAKDRSWEVFYLDESSLSFEENLSSSSLFGNERFFILTDIKLLGKKQFEWLNKKCAVLLGNLIIYFEGGLNTPFLKSLPKNSKIEEYKLPKLIWSFLDHIYPKNYKLVLKELHKIIEEEAPEFVFSLIAKLFRDLYWVKTDAPTVPYPSWRVGKLKIQSSKFNEDELKEIIEKLSLIDIDVKTGKADLTSELDLLFLTKLQ